MRPDGLTGGAPMPLACREARAVCGRVHHQQGRSRCYAAFGLDGLRVDRYFLVAYALEQSLKMDILMKCVRPIMTTGLVHPSPKMGSSITALMGIFWFTIL